MRNQTGLCLRLGEGGATALSYGDGSYEGKEGKDGDELHCGERWSTRCFAVGGAQLYSGANHENHVHMSEDAVVSNILPGTMAELVRPSAGSEGWG